MTDFGGEGGWAPHSERPFEDGTNLYQKPTPKQDKGGGINPPPRALACGLENDAAGRLLPPRRIPLSASRSFATRGKPALGNRNPKRDMDRNLARPIAITL